MKFVLTVSYEDCNHKTTIRQLCPTTQEGELTVVKRVPKENPGFPGLISQKKVDKLIAEASNRANELLRSWRKKGLSPIRSGRLRLAGTSAFTKDLKGNMVEVSATIYVSFCKENLTKSEE